MTPSRVLKSLPAVKPAETLALSTTSLTADQLELLSRCANGISLRFERPEVVNALVFGGYADRGVAGIVRVTAKGQQYLQMWTIQTLKTRRLGAATHGSTGSAASL